MHRNQTAQRLRRNIVELYLSEQPGGAGARAGGAAAPAVSYGVRSVRYHNRAPAGLSR